ncbi:MAG: hypothetical protein HYW07_08325 [Candidatus Latescibacteria bacterium]|nr:hypothetical protein [Candidatus Latescibacterota bacterium]
MPVSVEALLDLLRGSLLVRQVRIVDYDETPSGSLEVKIRCQLAGDYQLQVWIHSESTAVDYAYQVFTEQPLWRPRRNR